MKSIFVLHVKNIFQALQHLEDEAVDSGTEINRSWERVASVWKESSKECLGFRQRMKRKEWMRANAWKAIDNRQTLKEKLTDAKSERLCERYQQQYSEADQQVKCLTRADKRAYIDGLPAEAEDAAKCNQKGTVYKITSSSVKSTKLMPTPSPKPSKDHFWQQTESKRNTGQNISERFWTDHHQKRMLCFSDIPKAAMTLTLTQWSQRKKR